MKNWLNILKKSFSHGDTSEELFKYNISTHNVYIKAFIINYLKFTFGFEVHNVFKTLFGYGQNLTERDDKINFNKLLTYYLDVENKSEFIEKQKHLNDKTLNDLNGTQTQFDFFSFITLAISHNDFDSITRYDHGNYSLSGLELLSPFGKCVIYLSKFKGNKEKYVFDTDHLISIMESRAIDGNFMPMRYLVKKLFIHSSDVLPDLNTDEIQLTDNSVNQLYSFTLFIERTDFHKLPKPYETNCRNYGNSNRFECLNECYLNGYNQKWNCTPNDNHLLTIVLKNGIIEPNVKFCYKDDKQIREFNNYLKSICFTQCLESCEQTLFSLSKDFIKSTSNYIELRYLPNIDINIKEYVFKKIIFSPQILLLDFFISVVNILSLWHGINVWELIMKTYDLIMVLVRIISTYITQRDITNHSIKSLIKVKILNNTV